MLTIRIKKQTPLKLEVGQSSQLPIEDLYPLEANATLEVNWALPATQKHLYISCREKFNGKHNQYIFMPDIEIVRTDEHELTKGAIKAIAQSLEVEPALLLALVEKESAGDGFLPDGRPRILYERHYFHDLTDGRFGGFPGISSPLQGGYHSSLMEWERMQRAASMDENAAWMSASWGLGQLMGENYEICGFKSIKQMVIQMFQSEQQQFAALVRFLENEGLLRYLVRHQFSKFARYFNGPNYDRGDMDPTNDYDVVLKSLYENYRHA